MNGILIDGQADSSTVAMVTQHSLSFPKIGWSGKIPCAVCIALCRVEILSVMGCTKSTVVAEKSGRERGDMMMRLYIAAD